MNEPSRISAEQHARGRAFRALHEQGTFLMPNAWNAGSACLLAAAGFEALGTTSAGFAYARALPDAAGRLPLAAAMADTRALTEAVALPVNADAENGYGDTPEAVARCIRACIEAGCVGAGIEDYAGDPARGLYDVALGAERIAAAREAADATGLAFTLTARAECFLYGVDDAFDESVRRLNRYRKAGADCLYAPGVGDPETIAALVQALGAPVNVVVGKRNCDLTVDVLRGCGVRRISIGGTLARAGLRLVERAAAEMRERGTFAFAAEQLTDAELARRFAGRGSA